MQICPRCAVPRRLDEMMTDRKYCRRCRADEVRQRYRLKAALRPRKERASVLAWQRLHPDQVRAKVERRRSLQTAAAGSFTPSEFRALCAHYQWRCLACAAEDRALSVDHVVPLTKGGNNSIKNIQPLCRPCNSRKRSQIIDSRTADLMFVWRNTAG
jgi:5-methylcytosine-specific restriction endonuclease McrA